jgi:hypothetical protein
MPVLCILHPCKPHIDPCFIFSYGRAAWCTGPGGRPAPWAHSSTLQSRSTAVGRWVEHRRGCGRRLLLNATAQTTRGRQHPPPQRCCSHAWPRRRARESNAAVLLTSHNTWPRPGSTPAPSSANRPFAAHLPWAAHCTSPGKCRVSAVHEAHVTCISASCMLGTLPGWAGCGWEQLGHAPARTSTVTERVARPTRRWCEGWGECLSSTALRARARCDAAGTWRWWRQRRWHQVALRRSAGGQEDAGRLDGRRGGGGERMLQKSGGRLHSMRQSAGCVRRLCA